MIQYYNTVNEALSDLQTSRIVGHAFLDAVRIIDADDADNPEQEDENALKRAEEAERQRLRAELEAQRGGNTSGGYSGSSSSRPSSSAGTQKYETVRGSVVNVEYEDGTNFIINYNSYDITVECDGETYEVEALNFIRIDG